MPNPLLSVAGVCERDIDLLLLEEFWSSEDFQQWFAKRTLPPERIVDQLIHAEPWVMQPTGESDLEVAFADVNGDQLRLLIENKIDASFQPQQAERYKERGRTYVKRGECAAFYTVLVAPKWYLDSADAEKEFDASLSYESVKSWFLTQLAMGPRRLYKAELLQAAIEKATSGYQLRPVTDVTEFWQAYWEMACKHAPELQMKVDPRGKGPRSGFINFYPAGLPTKVGVQLLHKIPLGRSTLGNVDLQFARMGERLLEFRQALAAHIDPDMELEQAGGSGVIRLVVPELDVRADFAPQAKNALEGLRAAKRLAAWILDHQTLIKDRVSVWGLTKRLGRSTRIG